MLIMFLSSFLIPIFVFDMYSVIKEQNKHVRLACCSGSPCYKISLLDCLGSAESF